MIWERITTEFSIVSRNMCRTIVSGYTTRIIVSIIIMTCKCSEFDPWSMLLWFWFFERTLWFSICWVYEIMLHYWNWRISNTSKMRIGERETRKKKKYKHKSKINSSAVTTSTLVSLETVNGSLILIKNE